MSELCRNSRITLHIETRINDDDDDDECLNCGRENGRRSHRSFFAELNYVWEEQLYGGLNAIEERCLQIDDTGHLLRVTVQDRCYLENCIYECKLGQMLTFEASKVICEELREVRTSDLSAQHSRNLHWAARAIVRS